MSAPIYCSLLRSPLSQKWGLYLANYSPDDRMDFGLTLI